MSDEELRELERRARTGGPAELAAWTQALLRAGALPPERVELLGWLETRPEPTGPASPAAALASGLVRFGSEAVHEAAIAAARAVLDDWESKSLDERPRRAIEAAEAWLREPGREALARAKEAAREARAAGEGVVADHSDELVDKLEHGDELWIECHSGVAILAAVAAELCGVDGVDAARSLAIELEQACEGRTIHVGEPEDAERADEGHGSLLPPFTGKQLVEAMTEGLRRWALGLDASLRAERAARPLDQLPPLERELLAWIGAAQPADEAEWARGLARFGHDVCVRAALAATERALDHWDRDDDDRPLLARDAVRGWLACPCERHVEAATAALDDAVEAMGDASGPRAAAAAETAALAAEVVTVDAARAGEALATVLAAASSAVPPAKLRAAIAESLEAWARR